MKENKLRGFLSNGNWSDHPTYRKVFLLNVVLILLICICLFYTIVDVFLFSMYDAALINAAAAVLSLLTLIYFHKTGNYDLAAYLAIAILSFTLIVFFQVVQNKNYGLYWIATLPPVVYFLLGTKKARMITSLFCAYMLYFMLSKQSGWQPAEFNTESVFNITGATFGLIMMIGYFERSRKEASDGLFNANAVLKESKSELRLILDTAAEGIYGIDIEGKCTFCNIRCLEILDYKNEKELIGKDMHFLVHGKLKDGSVLPISECKIHKAIVSGEKMHTDDEVFWRADDTCFDVEYYSYPKYREDEIVGAVITFTDISEKKRNEERIQYLSCHDSLTGLINRQCFETAIQKYDNEEFLPLSIIFGDLNSLKLTNDIFGHAAGDELIKKVAEVLKTVCRRNDTVARIGGDEFVWLLPNTDAEAAGKVMERVKKQLLQEKYVVIRCSMSMGAYTKYSFDEDIEQALENAENEMYREKTYHKKNDEVVMLRELILGLYERSPRQKSHSENTSRLCEKMGIVLGWPQSDIKSLADAGYYHDIGKIVLSDALLNKTSKLTSLEKMEKLQHPVVGYRILSLFDNTLDLAEAVYYHHERWDGSGYPKGLQGEEIPVHSRIIGLAEQYDHLRNRITDKPLGKEDALLRIQQLSGIKFDLKLTDKFISIVRQ